MKLILQCVYCDQNQFASGRGSIEHVILSSLGGKKSSRNICCEACNNFLGIEIDARLAKQFHFFCTMMGVKTGRGKDAPTLTGMLTAGSESFDLLSGGASRLSASKVEIEEGENSFTISVTAKNEDAALYFMRQRLKSFGKDIPDLPSPSATSVTSFPEPIKHSLTIDQEEYRSIAKMGLTYAATLIAPERLRSEQFAQVRLFIKGDNLSNEFVRIEPVDVLPASPTINDLNHRIFFYASEEKKAAVALLQIFGYFTFSIVLSDSWTGSSIAKAHVIDPVTHERCDMDLPPANAIFEQIRKQSDQEEINSINWAISSILAIITQRQRDAYISQMVANSFDFKEGEADRFLSEEELQAGLEKLSLFAARFITRSSFEESIDLISYLNLPADQDKDQT